MDMRIEGLLLIVEGIVLGYLLSRFVYFALGLAGVPFVAWGFFELSDGIVMSRDGL